MTDYPLQQLSSTSPLLHQSPPKEVPFPTQSVSVPNTSNQPPPAQSLAQSGLEQQPQQPQPQQGNSYQTYQPQLQNNTMVPSQHNYQQTMTNNSYSPHHLSPHLDIPPLTPQTSSALLQQQQLPIQALQTMHSTPKPSVPATRGNKRATASSISNFAQPNSNLSFPPASGAPNTTSSRRSANNKKITPVEECFCICNKPSSLTLDDVDMFACDGKGCPYQWFHFECLGLPPDANLPDEFYCRECSGEGQYQLLPRYGGRNPPRSDL
jgi:hypothetical protein